MAAKITILGSGTMMPTLERNPAGFLVEVGGKRILLDCGHGIVRRLIDYGSDLQSLDAVFISHFHTDHFTDAFPLIHARWVNDVQTSQPHRKLLFLGPQDLKKRYLLWRKIFWPEPKECYPIDFKEGPLNLQVGNLQIETFEIQHVPFFQSVGIKIQYDGKKIVYTGDLGSRQDLDKLALETKDANLLIIEASFLKKTPNHYTFEQAKELAEKAKISHVLIVHVPPHLISETEQMISQNPKFQLAQDGQKIEI